MTNGVYITELTGGLMAKRRLIVFNGSVKIFTFNGNYVGVMNEEEAEKWFGPQDSWKKHEKRNDLYNLVWMVCGNIKETVVQNASYAVCKAKAKQLKQSINYSNGLLLPVPSNLS